MRRTHRGACVADRGSAATYDWEAPHRLQDGPSTCKSFQLAQRLLSGDGSNHGTCMGLRSGSTSTTSGTASIAGDSLEDRRLNAFGAFARSHYGNLVGFFRRRTGVVEDAEDDAQEALTRMLRYRNSEPATAWSYLLFRVAANVAHDRHRLARTHHVQDHVALESVPDLSSKATSPEDDVLRQQRLVLITRAIMALPPKCRKVFLLKRKYDLSHAEVADLCGISVKMVEKHLALALVRIRRSVGESSGDPSS